jgi:hypothetical protein
MINVFSIVPIEAFLDKRLTLEQLRVLGVLFSFRAKNKYGHRLANDGTDRRTVRNARD